MLVPLELLQLIREHVKEVVRLLLTVRRSVETVCHALFVTLTSGSTHPQLLILVLPVHWLTPHVLLALMVKSVLRVQEVKSLKLMVFPVWLLQLTVLLQTQQMLLNVRLAMEVMLFMDQQSFVLLVQQSLLAQLVTLMDLQASLSHVLLVQQEFLKQMVNLVSPLLLIAQLLNQQTKRNAQPAILTTLSIHQLNNV